MWWPFIVGRTYYPLYKWSVLKEFSGSDRKNQPFYHNEIFPYYFEAENVPLFRKNLVRACGPLGHLGWGWGHSMYISANRCLYPVLPYSCSKVSVAAFPKHSFILFKASNPMSSLLSYMMINEHVPDSLWYVALSNDNLACSSLVHFITNETSKRLVCMVYVTINPMRKCSLHGCHYL
jgi:hypothetical protein